MEFSPVLNFCVGLISSIGYCRLFLTINRPTVRWRFIVMLVVVFLIPPVCMVWKLQYRENVQGINNFLHLPSIFIDAISLIACALLGPNRRRALVASAFVFYVMYSAIEVFVVYLIAGFVYPLFNSNNVIELTFVIPWFYYLGLLLFNLIIMGYCFLSTRWIRKIKENPPVRLCVFICLFFLSFSIIIYLWFYYAVRQMP